MFKRILIPVDLGHVERSGIMIEQAKILADVHQSHITLLTVIADIPPYIALEIPTATLERNLAEVRGELDKLAQSHDLASSTTTLIQRGDPANGILDFAQKDKADLIIIASHQPGLSDYLLGSVAGKVVRHAHCTVMVLR